MEQINEEVKEEKIDIKSANQMLEETEKYALLNVMRKIEEAKEKGMTACYVNEHQNSLPKNVIKKLTEELKYDIKYSYFNNGDWFIKAYWVKPDQSGTIYNDQENKFVSIDEMFDF